MSQLIRPPLTELAIARGETVEELALHFINYHNRPSIPWSYRPGTIALLKAYSGLHNLSALMTVLNGQTIPTAISCNSDLINHAAPFAFERSTRILQLSPRRFPFGRDRTAAYRVPFFFVENGIVKLFFAQPRKTDVPTVEQLGMMATIHKRYLLDTEFFGQRTEVEFIDVGPALDGGVRKPSKYTLADLPLWSETRLADRLTLLAGGLEKAEASGLLAPKIKRPPRPTAQMPLFD